MKKYSNSMLKPLLFPADREPVKFTDLFRVIAHFLTFFYDDGDIRDSRCRPQINIV